MELIIVYVLGILVLSCSYYYDTRLHMNSVEIEINRSVNYNSNINPAEEENLIMNDRSS